jgi:aldose 1-epimerase
MKTAVFGKLESGQEIRMFTLENSIGMKAEIIEYGAILVSLSVPDKNGVFENVILGYDTIDQYVKDPFYMGATVGRSANRIKKGQFYLNGNVHQLTINMGRNHLHGGKTGFSKSVWTGYVKSSENDDTALRLEYISLDGEQGYPGRLDLSVTYTLNDTGELIIDYLGSTDSVTILNPTHHSYFNLSGDLKTQILNHELTIKANAYTPTDAESIPTGEIADVTGTPLDFRKPTIIGERINEKHEQLVLGQGYDHNWVLNNYTGLVRPVAELHEPKSGRLMIVSTDQPGVQFYSGNFLDGSVIGHNGIPMNFRTGLCLETQCFPDAPNHEHFPSSILEPGKYYTQQTIYRFSIK